MLPANNPKTQTFIKKLYEEFSLAAAEAAKASQSMTAQKSAAIQQETIAAAPIKNYKLLADDDILREGDDLDDEDEDEEIAGGKGSLIEPLDQAASKWKKLEADLKRIRDKEAQRDEIQQLRQSLEEQGKDKDGNNPLSKREQK